MEWPVVSVNGETMRTIELDGTVFGCKIREGLIYYAVRNELANLRVGTASTKTRGEVHGSRRKPWRQKGTGHARAGSRRSPIWVGGGTVFGPRPRDWSYSMPRKQKRSAMKTVLSLKAHNDQLRIIEDFRWEENALGKTKHLVALLSGVVAPRHVVLILGGSPNDDMVQRAARNIPWLRYLSYNRLKAHDLFYGEQIVMTETTAKRLNEFYAPQGVEA